MQRTFGLRRMSKVAALSQKSSKKAKKVPDQRVLFPLFGLEQPPSLTEEQSKLAKTVFNTTVKYLGDETNYLPLPVPPDISEIAICGRSNVGKSSLINSLLRMPKLAQVSKKPGTTQHIEFYGLKGHGLVFADLPGFGFAKVPLQVKQSWYSMIAGYLQSRGPATLRRTLLMVDVRRGLQAEDEEVIDMFDAHGIASQVVVTKADTVSKDMLEFQVQTIAAQTDHFQTVFPTLCVTSSKTGLGITELQHTIVQAGRLHRDRL